MQKPLHNSGITIINFINKLKKNSMIISIDVIEFDKIKYPFTITLSKLKTEVNFFNLVSKILHPTLHLIVKD